MRCGSAPGVQRFAAVPTSCGNMKAEHRTPFKRRRCFERHFPVPANDLHHCIPKSACLPGCLQWVQSSSIRRFCAPCYGPAMIGVEGASELFYSALQS
uniref:Uncharacterized protein n=1 Tax=Ascaris lumbricoides TaxID=6252 RepID=A0A0M3IFN1_ASCLU